MNVAGQTGVTRDENSLLVVFATAFLFPMRDLSGVISIHVSVGARFASNGSPVSSQGK